MNAQPEASTRELNSAIWATFVPTQVQLHGSNKLAEMMPQESTWMKGEELFARFAHMVMSVHRQQEAQ